MNVLLATSAAPSQTPFSTTEKRPPLGLGFLISVLRQAGHRVFFIDNYLKPSNFLETDYLWRHDIEVVGLYANTICFRDTRRMLWRLEYLRQTGRWRGKIIVGGPHAAVAPETIPEFVDHVVQGEGEGVILEVVEGRDSRRLIRAPRLENLDDLPRPAWDYFIHQPYNWTGDWFPGAPVFTLNTSRGCPYACTFCSVGSVWGRKYTCFSAERIVADIEYLVHTYGAQGIYFREDNFTVNRERTETFCRLLLQKGLKITWACETRVDALDRELLALMQRAGLAGLYFGVESGSPAVLERLHKGITVEQIRTAFRWCRELGLRTAASVIVGTPGEEPRDLELTRALLAEIQPTVTWYNVFVGIPTSRLYRQVLEKKEYDFIDDRGLVYLPGHNDRVRQFYGGGWDAGVPLRREPDGRLADPGVSVVMAVHNGALYLKEAVQSILNQTYPQFEFIIVDDASTDATPQLLEEFTDCRITVLRNPTRIGLTASLNRGIAQARAPYIARMDADDLSLPERLACQRQFLEEHPDCALVGSPYYLMDERGRLTGLVPVLTDPEELRAGLMEQNWFGHGSVMVRRQALLEVGGYNERYAYAQDYDLWLRLAERYQVANLPEPLYCWRKREEGISQARRAEQEHFARLARREAAARRQLPAPPATAAPEPPAAAPPPEPPLISVIVPTYNRPQMLVEAVESILHQTYPRVEIIVVNDGGVEVESLVAWLNRTGTLTYVRHDRNRGLAAARNTGLRLARGKYIAYLDDDDLFYPEHVETLVTALEQSRFRVAYTDACQAARIRDRGRWVTVSREVCLSHDFDRDSLLVQNLFPVLCVMHERACLEDVGLFDETLTSHEDWDLWIRLALKEEFLHIRKVTAEYSWCGDGSTMTSRIPEDFVRTLKLIHDRYAPYVADRPELKERQRRFLTEVLARPGMSPPPEKTSAVAPKEPVAPSLPPAGPGQASGSPPEAPPGSAAAPPPVSIIIPVYNHLELTQDCLNSLWEHTPAGLYELIVVDNASTDASGVFLAQQAAAGRLKLISNDANLGFSRACNQGARAAQGEFLLFLNNDTRVTPGWLEALLDTIRADETIAAVGAKLLYPDDSVQHAGVVFNREGRVYHLYRYLHRDHPAVNKVREFQVLTAACLVVRRAAFLAVGLFDENFLNGFEDVDLCLRLREAGWRLLYQPQAVVYHLESQTQGRFARELENCRYFRSKWQGRLVPDDESYYREDGLHLEWVRDAQGRRQAVLHDMNPNPFREEARARLEQGELLQALECYQKALRFNPLDPRHHLLQAEMEAVREMAAASATAEHA
ncbi:MAG: glycosyltransferase [Syntrophobacterales bacterium]|nr:glycosyltransferase [Syntrophobacterales bacterium]